MTTFDARTLYELLPAIVRLRDAERGGPLRELIDILGDQAAVIEGDLDRLEDDAFVETCSPWVLPYIGDLLGITGLPPSRGGYSARAEVGHTIAMRRRKGTAAVLEQLTKDVTGYGARAVELFRLVATTQSMKRIRPEHQTFVSVRDPTRLLDLGTAFEDAVGAPDLTHRPDVRRQKGSAARHNFPNVALFVFRINAYSRTRVPSYRIDDRRFTFHPLGAATGLYCAPRTERDIAHLAEPIDVPHPISRRELHASLVANSTELYGRGTGATRSILVSGPTGVEVPAEEVIACDLSAWTIPNWPAGKTLAIDSKLGRMVWKTNVPAGAGVTTSHHEGACADLGGGEYERASSLPVPAADVLHLTIPGPDATDLASALAKIAADGAERAVIEYTENGTIDIQPALLVWPPLAKRIELRASNGKRPVLRFTSAWSLATDEVEFALNGFLISAPQIEWKGRSSRIQIAHCTFVLPISPGPLDPPQLLTPGPLVFSAEGMSVEIEKSITGPLRLHPDSQASLTGSVVDAGSPFALALAGAAGSPFGGALSADKSTVIGKVWVAAAPLWQNSLFVAALAPADTWTAPIRVRRQQEGCVRFCYVPRGSLTPPRYKCLPGEAGEIAPTFTSLRLSDPAYMQLHTSCDPAIRRGSEVESEMGVFHDQYQPEREAHLCARLEEYLRFGLEAGIVYAS